MEWSGVEWSGVDGLEEVDGPEEADRPAGDGADQQGMEQTSRFGLTNI